MHADNCCATPGHKEHMTCPKVSVLVPVYNASAYLEQCLDSLVRQTLDGLEIIVLDDGSTDGSWEILKAHAAKDARIRTIRKHNSGYGDTLNLGISLAKGEYIGIVEADDFAEPALFARLYSLAREHGAEIVKCSYRRYWSKFRTCVVPLSPQALCGRVLQPAQHPEVLRMPLYVWSAIYQRSFLLENAIAFLPTPGASYQDISFSFRAFTRAKRAFFTDEPLVNYRQSNMAASTRSREKIFCVRDEFEAIEQCIHENGLLSLQDIFYELRARAFLWNLTRLRHANRKVFLGYAFPLFVQALALLEAGRIQLEERQARRLRLLVRYPALFLLKYRLLDPVRTGGRLLRAALARY
jgi:Glycosyltransferases involved in cell wall biogenesis